MCQRNWAKYNSSLVQRGSLSFYCSPETIKILRKASKTRKQNGRPPYPLQLILLLTLLKISYSLSYRECQGMANSLFLPYGIAVPCYTTICRRMRHLFQCLPRLSRRRPKICILDSSGFKVSGEGEWKTKIHGKSYRRSWSKVHLLVDSDSNEVINLIVTSPEIGDISVGLEFLKKLPSSTKAILADGAYDGERFRYLAYSNGVTAIVPPPRTAKPRLNEWFKERNDALTIIRSLGNDKAARRLWGKLTGYCHRVKGEFATQSAISTYCNKTALCKGVSLQKLLLSISTVSLPANKRTSSTFLALTASCKRLERLVAFTPINAATCLIFSSVSVYLASN